MGVPAGWKDVGTTLTAPNGMPVVRGFREYILNNPWDKEDLADVPREHTRRGHRLVH